MTNHSAKERRALGGLLSARDKAIARVLQRSSKPLSAYDLVNLLRDHGAIAPTTVYRSLRRLIDIGMAHRLESLNAFVSCAHACRHGPAMFAICDGCGRVAEFDDEVIAAHLATWAQYAEFSVSRTAVELRGRCKSCRAQAVAGAP